MIKFQKKKLKNYKITKVEGQNMYHFDAKKKLKKLVLNNLDNFKNQ